VAAGSYHCLAVNADGQVYQWGKLYKLGDTKQYFGGVIKLTGMKDSSQRMIDKSHRLYYEGKKEKIDGESESNQNFGTFIPFLQKVPILVEGLENVKIVSVAAGYSFSMAVSERGELYGWGYNDKYQLGLRHRYNQERPQLIKDLCHETIIQVACGQQHTLALTKNGKVYSWGLGVFGQLGHGRLSDKASPTLIKHLEDYRIVQVACGAHHSLVRDETGKVWSFGSSEYGQQGGSKSHEDWGTGERGNSKEKTYFYATPRLVESSFGGRPVVFIACGNLHNIAINESGELYTWGWGVQGALGHGNRRFQLYPTLVTKLRGEPISAAAASGNHTLAITASGSSTWAFDFKPLVNNPLFSDVIFRIQGRAIYAHQVIVYSRCQHLYRISLMLTRFAGRSPHDDIVIDDVEYHVFLALMYYLYTDHLKVPPHLVGKLKHLATRYGLPRLVALCQRLSELDKEYGDKQDAVAIPPSQFTTDMMEAVNNKAFADMLIETRNTEGITTLIYAHKSILFSRSDYFRVILNPNSAFCERGKSTFIFPEISQEIFLELLRFLYTNTIPELNENTVVDLIMGADRFLIEDMKSKIASILEDSIDVENVITMLAISERTNSPRLKKACLNFFVVQFEQVKNSEDIKYLKYCSPTVLREIDFLCTKRLGTQPGEVVRLVATLT
jgi:hypothetical protein